MRQFLGILGGGARGLSHALTKWPLLLAIVFFAFDQGPHLSLDWLSVRSMNGSGRISCNYLGSRGIQDHYEHFCPLLIWLDTSEVQP